MPDSARLIIGPIIKFVGLHLLLALSYIIVFYFTNTHESGEDSDGHRNCRVQAAIFSLGTAGFLFGYFV